MRVGRKCDEMGINYFNRDDRDLEFVLFEHLGIEGLLQRVPGGIVCL